MSRVPGTFTRLPEAKSENERQLAAAAFKHHARDAYQWGDLVLEAYDTLDARVQELEAALRERDEFFAYLADGMCGHLSDECLDRIAALASQATEETT